jgi:hypothetical protein
MNSAQKRFIAWYRPGRERRAMKSFVRRRNRSGEEYRAGGSAVGHYEVYRG